MIHCVLKAMVTMVMIHCIHSRRDSAGMNSVRGRSSTSAVMFKTHPCRFTPSVRFTPCSPSAREVRFSSQVSP